MAKPSATKTLNRIPERAKIAGVCAGLADFFGLETWHVRLAVVLAFFLTGGGPILLAYLIAWFILEPKGSHADNDSRKATHSSGAEVSAAVESSLRKVKEKIFSHKNHPDTVDLANLRSRLVKVQQRVQSLEAYVTSKEFTFERELAD